MSMATRWAWLGLGALVLAAPAWAAQNAAARFRQIYQQEWNWRSAQSGVLSSG